MAQAARKREYDVYGSLAYDFEPQREQQYEKIPQDNPDWQIDPNANIGARPRQAARNKQAIAPAAVVGFVIAAALFMVCMVARIQLLEISNESAELSSRLTELQKEQTRLEIEYESAFNLNEIEEYAVSTLGMQKPFADQVVYIDTAAQDKAVVIPAAESKNFVERAWEFFTSIGSYLK